MSKREPTADELRRLAKSAARLSLRVPHGLRAFDMARDHLDGAAYWLEHEAERAERIERKHFPMDNEDSGASE